MTNALSRVPDAEPAAIRHQVLKLCLALQDAVDVQSVKRVVDASAFLADAAKKAHLCLEAVNEVQQVRLAAEIKLGHELSRMKDAGQITHAHSPSVVTREDNRKLSDYGITRNLSSRSQFFAEHEDQVRALLPQILAQLSELSVLQLYADLRRRDATAALTRELDEIARVSPPTPEGVFDVMVIDPPWPMERVKLDTRPLQPVELDYPTMTEEELFVWDVPRRKAAEDCHLFLWTTHKFLPIAFACLQSWDAEYTCTFVWHKPNGFQPFNLPKFNCEFCLYARYGNPRFLDLKAFNVCFDAPVTGHSEKPEAFYDLLRRVTGGRRLDLFNRRPIEGFIGWGQEAVAALRD